MSTAFPYDCDLKREGHHELVGALAFLKGASGNFGRFDLRGWIDEHLVTPGLMPQHATVTERGAGTLPVVAPSAGFDREAHGPLWDLLAIARARVLDALRGFRGTPANDRFLAGAIFGRRVGRVRFGKQSVWAARLPVGETLSNIVLSLFVVDILSHRERYETSLCFCEVCGNVFFDATSSMPLRCAEDYLARPSFARANG